MNDAFDMAMDDGETVGQADELYDQILNEIGMGINSDIKVNDNNIANPVAAPGQVSSHTREQD